MSTHKSIDLICVAVLLLTLLLTVLFMNGGRLGIQTLVDEDADAFPPQDAPADRPGFVPVRSGELYEEHIPVTDQPAEEPRPARRLWMR